MTDPETSRHVEIKDDDDRTAAVADVTTRPADTYGRHRPDLDVREERERTARGPGRLGR